MGKDLLYSILIIAFMFVTEGFLPLFKGRKRRFLHAATNIVFALGNGIMIKIFFAGLITKVIIWSGNTSFGLLQLIPIPGYLKGIFAFVFFDLWMYFWHRINHVNKFLWRFHRMHHSDLEMDATTALRFHPGEIFLSSILRLAVIPLLGMGLIHFALYKLALSPIILFHHSNIALPESVDKILRSIIVSPNMHRVHHSQIWSETNSNYASVFSFWDRIFGSFRKREDLTAITYGLRTLREPFWQSIGGMFLTPLYGSNYLRNNLLKRKKL